MVEPKTGGGCGCLGLIVFILIPILVLLALAVVGPAVGNIYSNITMAL